MSASLRISTLVWIAILVAAVGFLTWVNHARAQRVEYVSGLANPALVRDAASPTGYAGGQRELIVPERNGAGFDWIAQTQQMFAQREWRVRHVDYENAPLGREVRATSPYRWWLGLVAWVDHGVSGRPLGLAVEHAALYADPLLHSLALVGVTVFVAWRFGGLAAAMLALGLATFYPFAAGFLPGVTDHHGLARILGLASILLLLAGLREGVRPARWFALAGMAGGLGLWIDVSTQMPILMGILLGALLAGWVGRQGGAGVSAGGLPAGLWRTWAWSGAVTVLAACLAEYFPGHLGGWNLEAIHPLYGLAWLGGGELLAVAVGWIQREKPDWTLRGAGTVVLAAAAVVAVPVVLGWTDSKGFLVRDLLSVRLTSQPDGMVAATSWAWFARAGMNATVIATLLPLLVMLPAAVLWWRRSTRAESRFLLAVAAGPVLVALGLATRQLTWWSMLDGALLALLVAGTAGRLPAAGGPDRWLWPALLAGLALVGGRQVWPQVKIDHSLTLTSREAEELIERHLAHWLTKRTGETGVVVYAPPLESTTLGFYGGLHGIGTFSGDNRAGFGVTLMIAAANTLEEAQALLQKRGVRYIMLPSWDPFFDEFARLYLASQFANRKSFLANELRRWNLPPWLRPLPYQMPEIGGFEDQSVLVFEVVEDQSPAVATSRLAEYFVETGRLEQAAVAGEALRRFPGDVGALAARAQVQFGRDDAAGAAQSLAILQSRLEAGADRYLPWDRRVSLAITLAQGGLIAPAREQLRRCLVELNEQRLRSLTPGSLFKLLVLSRGLDSPIADPLLSKLAVELLPAGLSSRL